MLATIRAGHKMMAEMDVCLTEMKDGRTEIKTGQETTEACLECKERTSEEIEYEEVHEEVPKEDEAVETDRAPNRNLGAEHRQKPKERTQGKDGSRRNLAVARRWTTCRVAVARRKGHIVRKNQTRDKVARGTWRG
jgi:hypothetical protein